MLLFSLALRLYSQDEIKANPLRIMFYNVENLFDCYNDTLKNDDDFLPGGVMRWNGKRYNQKINSLYKTIVAAGEWTAPSIVGFCEVENRKVIEDLIYDTYLSNSSWGIIHEDSPDERGIDVCLIFKKDLVRMIDYRYLIPSLENKREFLSRSVLYVRFEVLTDTLHVIVNHWPSRRGGVLAGEYLREAVSQMVRETADSISDYNKGKAKIIIMGDFNCTPDDAVIVKITRFGKSIGKKIPLSMINLTEKLSAMGFGTYRYKGVWEMIDQILVSEWLLNCPGGLYTSHEMFRVFKPDFLLRKDPNYPGSMPFSTYRGYRYQGGFSDHLPVLVDLGFR